MRDLRKILSGSTIVAFATVLALAGCGGAGTSTDGSGGGAEPPEREETMTEEEKEELLRLLEKLEAVESEE